MTHTLPQLPYNYNTLEPYIDEKTIEIHHSKHHQAYIDKLNIALQKHPDLFEKSIKELLKNINSVPEDIRTAVKNNGGGHFNHTLFWENLSPNSPKEPKGELKEAINNKFGSFENFKKEFTEQATLHFGSGWTWLCIEPNNELIIISTKNQNCPLSEGLTPILTIDLWEHSYYLKYQNRRPEYIEAWWNIVNWEKINLKNF